MRILYINKAFLLVVTLTVISNLIYSPVSLSAEKERSVYIDPAYGGKENGPVVTKQRKTADIVLAISKNIKSLLESKGLVANISRSEELHVPLDDRITRARLLGADVYINITVNRSKNDCIRIFYPRVKSHVQKDDMNAIIQDLTNEDRVDKSIRLAVFLSKNLNKVEPSFFVKSQSVESYALDKTHCPTVVLDFGVSKSKSPYVLDSVLMDKIIRAVSDGIRDYFTSPESN